MQKNEKNRLIAGVLLIIVGAAGLVVGSKLHDKLARVVVIIISIISLGIGVYATQSGYDALSMGIIADGRLGETPSSLHKFTDYNQFERALIDAFRREPKLHRITFLCPDGSKKLTVYNLIGVWGIPHNSIECADGKKLIDYSEKKN